MVRLFELEFSLLFVNTAKALRRNNIVLYIALFLFIKNEIEIMLKLISFGFFLICYLMEHVRGDILNSGNQEVLHRIIDATNKTLSEHRALVEGDIGHASMILQFLLHLIK